MERAPTMPFALTQLRIVEIFLKRIIFAINNKQELQLYYLLSKTALRT